MSALKKRPQGATGIRQSHWERLIFRWSGMEPIGEVKLACAVVAQAIADEPEAADKEQREPYGDEFFAHGVMRWCSLLGIDPAFLRAQLEVAVRAHASDVAEAA